MRLIPRLASDTAMSFSLILEKPSVVERSCQAVSERWQPDPTAPLLHLRQLSSGRDNPRLLSRRIELFEIGDDIVNLLRIFQAWKSHFGTRYLGPRILDVFAEGFIPGDAGVLVRRRIAVA